MVCPTFFTYDKNRLKAMDIKGKIHLFVIEKNSDVCYTQIG